jgi:hypothetical protein
MFMIRSTRAGLTLSQTRQSALGPQEKIGPLKVTNGGKEAYETQYKGNSFYFFPLQMLQVRRAYDTLNPGLVSISST